MQKYRISPFKKRQIKQQQQNFVLDCTNPLTSKLPSYSSLKDQFLKYYVIRVSKKKFNKSKTTAVPKSKDEQKVKQDTVYAGYFSKENIKPSVNKKEFEQFLKRKKQCVLYQTVHREYKQKRFPGNPSHNASINQNQNQNSRNLGELPLSHSQSNQENYNERLVTQIDEIQASRKSQVDDQPVFQQIQERQECKQQKKNTYSNGGIFTEDNKQNQVFEQNQNDNQFPKQVNQNSNKQIERPSEFTKDKVKIDLPKEIERCNEFTEEIMNEASVKQVEVVKEIQQLKQQKQSQIVLKGQNEEILRQIVNNEQEVQNVPLDSSELNQKCEQTQKQAQQFLQQEVLQ